MIIEVKESVYKGILLEHVKDKGWKCNLGGTEYLFPNYVAAQAAIDEIFADIKPIVTKRKGEKIKTEQKNKGDELYNALLKYAKSEEEYLRIVMQLLQAQKAALQSNDCEAAEEITDALIETLQSDLEE